MSLASFDSRIDLCHRRVGDCHAPSRRRQSSTQQEWPLWLARKQRLAAALPLLRRASELDGSNSRYAYVYGVALNSAGETAEALSVLRRAHVRQAADLEILIALVTISQAGGDIPGARAYAEELVRLAPNDTSARQLRDSLWQ